ncbi:hypothetical protein AAJ76_1890004573 [Vairimorpha ceranae]|uniref:Uncharacterized protein n=1 Tax=Vairimorpha ceranae TaxID=40302 RepID=A0A0F9YM80_9MICR|nr:hypothetical protein AAJ76_1890004573 [Vairimorpha ceranae]KKO73882.1 hypothetical protein AAJ76_1890004573 [Vairimorpha ceranae]
MINLKILLLFLKSYFLLLTFKCTNKCLLRNIFLYDNLSTNIDSK